MKGAAYAASGMIKRLGMATFKEMEILKKMEDVSFAGKKTEPVRKQAGLHMFECLSFALGK